MDNDVERQRIIEAEQQKRDFAALFAQLDHPDTVASVDRGLMQLAAVIGHGRRSGGLRH